MTNTARKAAIFVDEATLAAMSMSDIFIPTGPAKVIAEGVWVGPVEIVDRRGETWFLVRLGGIIDVLKRTEAEALEAAAPQIRRYVNRQEDNRARAAVEAKRQADVAASIAKCPKHRLREIQIGRCLYRIVCDCGYVETVSSDG